MQAKIEKTLQETTKKYMECDEEKLVVEATAETGMSFAVQKHINGLVLLGKVKRNFNPSGRKTLFWAFENAEMGDVLGAKPHKNGEVEQNERA